MPRRVNRKESDWKDSTTVCRRRREGKEEIQRVAAGQTGQARLIRRKLGKEKEAALQYRL